MPAWMSPPSPSADPWAYYSGAFDGAKGLLLTLAGLVVVRGARAPAGGVPATGGR